MKVLFIGLGSIGKRQLKELRKFRKWDIYALRSYKGQDQAPVRGVKILSDWKDVDRVKPDMAFITNPTSLHVATAMKCARRGMDLFIEKPLGSSLKGLKELEQACRQNKCAVYVAYLLRFHPVIQDLKKRLAKDKGKFLHLRVQTTSFLHRWRKGTDPKKSYSSSAKMGGGVVYDLSHEFDFVQYLLGDIKKMSGQYYRRSQLTVDAEDFADILISTRSGPANVHMNYASHKEQRVIEIDFKDKTVEGDLINGTVKVYRAGKQVSIKRYTKGYRESFEKQMNYFLTNIGRRTMMNDLKEAVPLFKKIYAFKKAAG